MVCPSLFAPIVIPLVVFELSILNVPVESKDISDPSTVKVPSMSVSPKVVVPVRVKPSLSWEISTWLSVIVVVIPPVPKNVSVSPPATVSFAPLFPAISNPVDIPIVEIAVTWPSALTVIWGILVLLPNWPTSLFTVANLAVVTASFAILVVVTPLSLIPNPVDTISNEDPDKRILASTVVWPLYPTSVEPSDEIKIPLVPLNFLMSVLDIAILFKLAPLPLKNGAYKVVSPVDEPEPTYVIFPPNSIEPVNLWMSSGPSPNTVLADVTKAVVDANENPPMSKVLVPILEAGILEPEIFRVCWPVPP